jgi:hypothetical protein
VTKLLTSPPWGVLRYAQGAAAQAIADIADLHRTFVPGDVPSIVNWDGAARAARTASETCEGAELYAVRAASQSTSLVETDDWDTLDAVTGNALRAHRLANGDAGAARMVEVTRNAIRSWRRLAGLSVVSNDPSLAPGRATWNQLCRWPSRRSRIVRKIAALAASTAMPARTTCEPS